MFNRNKGLFFALFTLLVTWVMVTAGSLTQTAHAQAIVKLEVTTGLDNSCAAGESVSVLAGTQVHFCYEVTNIGAVDLTITSLADATLGIELVTSLADTMLSPGEVTIVTVARTLTADTTASATVMTAENATDSDTASAIVFDPCASPNVVTDTVSLNEAIGCYNAAVGGSYIISVTDSFTLTAATVPITNTTGADLTIEGNSNVIDGAGTRIFTIESAAVSITEITLQGADDGDGGAIESTGTLTMTDSFVVDNTAVNDAAGLLIVDGIVVLSRMEFGRNIAGEEGGAIYMLTGTLTIDDSTFYQNETGEDGGAISVQDGIFLLTNSDVISNTSVESVGGIRAGGSTTIINSTIRNNQANDGSTGGISNGGQMTIDHSLVDNNRTTGSGGGIFNSDLLTVTNSTVISNSARGGGGIHNFRGTITVSNSSILSNTATSSGGGISDVGNGGGDSTIVQSTIANNRAGSDGAAVYTEFSNIIIMNSTLSDNHADGDGGGVYSYDSTATVSHITLKNNSATMGNGLYVYLDGGPAVITMTDSIIDNGADNCVTDGGGSVVAGSDSISNDGSCDSATVATTAAIALAPLADNGCVEQHTTRTGLACVETHALMVGSAVIDAAVNSTLTADQRGFARPMGTAADSGAYEAACTNSPWLVSDTATLNYAIACYDQEIGGSHIISVTDSFTLTAATVPITNTSGADLTITGNDHTIDGDMSHRLFTVLSSDIHISDLTLQHGNAPSDCAVNGFSSIDCGGAIKINGVLTATLDNVILQENSASYGAGITVQFANVTIGASQLLNNNGYYGGGWSLHDGGNLAIQETVISENDAFITGGGGYSEGGGATLTMTNSIVYSNTAGDSGGLFASDTIVTIDSTLFEMNQANNRAGGINLNANLETIITNSAFYSNTAKNGNGGGLHLATAFGNVVAITDTTIAYNQAVDGNGGGIWRAADFLMTIDNSTISHNEASQNGGGYYGDGFTKINHTTIAYNTAPNGSGVFGADNSGSLVELRHSIIMHDDNATGDDCSYPSGDDFLIDSDSSNLDSDGSCKEAIIATDMGLDQLADNGGAVLLDGSSPKTHALQLDSPAINAAVNSTLTNDQIGTVRPQYGVNDSGAIEFAPTCTLTSPYLVSDTATLNEAITCFNNDAIDGTHVISVTADITLITQTVPINNLMDVELDIEGNGYTIDGADSYRILTVEDAFTLRIHEWTMTNGLGIDDCGGQRCGGAFKVENRSYVALYSTSVMSNSAELGGGIYNDTGNIQFYNSTVSYNSADDGGGAFSTGTAARFSILHPSLFTHNYATNRGGAIYSEQELNFFDSQMAYNTAGSDGGGIYATSGLRANDSAFHHNSVISGSGGAIYSQASVDISNSTISNNEASVQGGAIDVTGNLQLYYVTIAENRAPVGSGIVQSVGSNTNRLQIIRHSIVTHDPAVTTGVDCVLETTQFPPNPNDVSTQAQIFG